MKALDRPGLDVLFCLLTERGYELSGPTVRDGVVVYDTVRSPADLPEGWADAQDAGRYRLRHEGGRALFGHAVGPHSAKRLLHPPVIELWKADTRAGDGRFEVVQGPVAAPRRALIGVRACDLAALAIQDRVFLGGPRPDPVYRARRESVFLVAVACTRPSGTCFCASMGTGPRPRAGADLALVEVVSESSHVFLLEAGSPGGAEVAAGLPLREPTADELRAAEEALTAAEARMGRALDPEEARRALAASGEHPRWEEVARRCLACGNCTLVCPTCFCFTVEDASDLAGTAASRVRRWDSCFGLEFSYVHGGSVRTSAAARYRQWITHKLSTWHEQFGTAGCVGCGRCITWCPTGIDITEEARAVAARGRSEP